MIRWTLKLPAWRLLWLALRRLRSRLGLSLLSLLSIVLTIGLISSISIFSQGVSYLILREELAELSRLTRRPPLAFRFYYNTTNPLDFAGIQDVKDTFAQLVEAQGSLSINQTVTLIRSPSLGLQALPEFEAQQGWERTTLLNETRLLVLTDVQERIVSVEGAPFGTSTVEAQRDSLPVWIHQDMAWQMGLQVGEQYELDVWGTPNRLQISIAGVWQEKDPDEVYWSGPHINLEAVFLVTETDYETLAQPYFGSNSRSVHWYMLPEEQGLTLTEADGAAQGLALVPNIASTTLPGTRLDVSPLEPLEDYRLRRASLSGLLLAFSLPALGLLFYFLWLLSAVAAQFQQEEMAILVSRGTGRGFLLGMIGLEALLLLGAGTPIGLGLGLGLARLMGTTTNFLTFSPREGFPATFFGLDWRLFIAAILLLLVARLIPAMSRANRSIVAHLRERSRPLARSGLVKLTIDAALIVLSLYAYQQLQDRGSLGIIGWEPEGNPFRDPLLLIAPTLFVFTAALVLAHLFPLFLRPFDTLSRWLRRFALYMGMQQLRRQSGQYASPLFLVMVCLSLGAFYASLALSLDQWLLDRIYYNVGTDYRFAQVEDIPLDSGFGDTISPDTLVTSTGEKTGPWQLPVSDYLSIPGVIGATRVGDYEARVRRPGQTVIRTRFLGIDRLDFPSIAYFRSDFTEEALGELMNRLGMVPNGMLVSRQFLAENNLQLGQEIDLQVEADVVADPWPFVIVGVYDYFPTIYPADQETIVGNLDFIFERQGTPSLHHIWLKTEPGLEAQTILIGLRNMDVLAGLTKDANALIKQDQDRVERIGLFGVLSIGFLSGALLAGLGLLVYTYASLQARLQQVSVLRAVGIYTREVLTMVSIEYVGVIFYGIAGGTLIGILVSYLFVPFYRFSTEAAFALPPFVPQIAWGQIGWLALIFAAVLLVSQAIILQRVTRRDIFQALRMGQRE